MARILFLIAATLTFGAVFWFMLAEIGKKPDFMKAPPSFHARQAKVILPLMALAFVFVLLASAAKSWGWP